MLWLKLRVRNSLPHGMRPCLRVKLGTLLLLWLLGTAGAQEGHIESELLEHLLVKSGYNKEARPVTGPNSSIEVYATFGLNAIVKFVENDQVLKTTAWILVQWYDPRLAWNSSVSSLQNLFLSAGKIWRPWLYVTNSINGFEQMRNDDDEVQVQQSGIVSWITTQLMETMCSMDISMYPFDTQTCNIYIGPIFGFVSNTSLHCLVCTVILSSYQNNTEWDIKNTSITVHEYTEGMLRGMKLLKVQLILERRYLFYLLALILPIPCLSVLTPTVFALPPDGGEKISLAVSVLLSYTVFLSGLTGSLPPNSDKVCLFSVYLALMIIISALSALLAAVIICLHSRQGRVTPMWRYIICAYCRRKKQRVNPLPHKPRDDVMSVFDNGLSGQEGKTSEADDVVAPKATSRSQGMAWEGENEITWQEVANFLDKVGMILCLLLTLGCSAFYAFSIA